MSGGNLTIGHNPYIVGNPIKSRDMFFGREDDFLFISRKVGLDKANQVIILCGERRSGKTSILFQILSGRLGDQFLPVLIDMQILAGIRSDADFYRAVVETGCAQLRLPGIELPALESGADAGGGERLFHDFLAAVARSRPQKVMLILLDEYELLEAKIKERILTEAVVHFLSGVLEGALPISFIFTGSTNLENRKVDFWKALLGKSIYRKISYLSRDDTRRLVTEPLGDAVVWPEPVIDRVYRLSGGQPFYVQVVCQNLVDLLIEEARRDPGEADLENVVKDIIENPLPQMIYSWNSLSDWTKFALSSLAGTLVAARDRSDAGGVYHFLKTSKIVLPFNRERLNVFLEEAYQKEFLDKGDDDAYAFRMDLYRRWIRKEHSVWKVLKEVNLEVKQRRSRIKVVAVGAAAAILTAGLLVFFLRDGRQHGLENLFDKISSGDVSGLKGKVAGIVLKANQSPFRVTLEDGLTLTSEGGPDERVIALPPLDPGAHAFTVVNPATGEKLTVRGTIGRNTKELRADFVKIETVAAVGSLFLSSTPEGALIRIDGKSAGVTPKIIPGLAAGAHRLELELEGFATARAAVTVKAGVITEKKTALEESFGFLALNVTPTAKIYIDGTYLVDTPIVKPVRVRTGNHRLRILNDSLKTDVEVPVLVLENETLLVERSLKK
jgi:hypothetical protein